MNLLNSQEGLELETYVFFLLAAVLIAPVVLYRVVEIVAEGVIQPIVVEEECQHSTSPCRIHISDVVVVTVTVNHEQELHDEREHRCNGC